MERTTPSRTSWRRARRGDVMAQRYRPAEAGSAPRRDYRLRWGAPRSRAALGGSTEEAGSRMSTAQHTAATVVDWLQQGRRVAAGLLVGIDGPAPLAAGASMYVDADGVIEGSVTGGCVESAVAQEAMAVLAGEAGPRLITYGISDELAGTVGLMCGGTVHIFVHELTGSSQEATVRGLRAFVDA